MPRHQHVCVFHDFSRSLPLAAFLMLLVAGCDTQSDASQPRQTTLTVVSVNGLSTSLSFEAPNKQAEDAFVREVSRFTKEFAQNSDLSARLFTADPSTAAPVWTVNGAQNERLSCFGFAFNKYARDFAPFAGVRVTSASPGVQTPVVVGTRVPAALASTMMSDDCTMTYECGICRTVDPTQRGCIAKLQCFGQSPVCSTANVMMCAHHQTPCTNEEVGD